MPSKLAGVSGAIQYDLDIMCFADDHDDGVHMIETTEDSDKGNAIVECPECGRRRAAKVHVAMLRGETDA